jgi:hypothetical protein
MEGVDTIPELTTRIESIFGDEKPDNAVILGTVHRNKGLESTRIFVLAPGLIPPSHGQKWPKTPGILSRKTIFP